MSTSEEDPRDEQLLEKYRQAGETDAAAPGPAVRANVMAEARRLAKQNAAAQAHVLPQSGSDAISVAPAHQPAANDSQWKIPAFGTLGAAIVVALIFAPRLWQQPPVSADATRQTEKLGSAAPAADAAVAARAAGAASAPRAPGAPLAPAEPLAREAAPVQAQAATSVRDAANAAVRTASRQREDHAADGASPADAEVAANALAAAKNAPRVATLLDQGAAIDVRDESGRTPLTLAAIRGDVSTVRLLLSRGANPHVADNYGLTPLDYARESKVAAITRLLEDAAAVP